jgi:putative component of membrane protein insertase Oxa1/YidC/SpoIIIJ protein YidD
VKTLLLTLIRLYQRHVSPRKGFACAYRVHTGCASCSHLGYRAIRRYGVWQGLVSCKPASRAVASPTGGTRPCTHPRSLVPTTGDLLKPGFAMWVVTCPLIAGPATRLAVWRNVLPRAAAVIAATGTAGKRRRIRISTSTFHRRQIANA